LVIAIACLWKFPEVSQRLTLSGLSLSANVCRASLAYFKTWSASE